MTDKQTKHTPEQKALIALLFFCYAAGIAVFIARGDAAVFDLLTGCLVAAFVAMALGRALAAAGERGLLAFGKVAGRYLELLGIAIPCLYFLVEIIRELLTGSRNPVELLPAWTGQLVLSSLLIILFAVIEKLLRSEADHKQEAERLRRQLAAANRERDKLLAYEGAVRELKASLDSTDIRGTEVIRRIDMLLADKRRRHVRGVRA